MEQLFLTASKDYKEIDEYLEANAIKKPLLVCGHSLAKLKLGEYFANLEKCKDVQVIYFREFHPNPDYESVVQGTALFLQEQCDAVFAVGGGSAMDVAKCIKLFSNMNRKENYLKQPIHPNNIPLFAVPTTAGTGSESTRYAVIYYEGEKQSVADDSMIPSTVLLDASLLNTLPLYQKKAPLLDALCHAIESYWSVNSTEESKKYSHKALELIMQYKDAFLNGEESANQPIMMAANLAGKAINITQTTAGHAMCYKLTSLYGIAHGHAAALCVTALWEYMIDNTDKCIDVRGEEYLTETFKQIAQSIGYQSVQEAIEGLRKLLEVWGINKPRKRNVMELEMLVSSVNAERLKNHPIELKQENIQKIYQKILQ